MLGDIIKSEFCLPDSLVKNKKITCHVDPRHHQERSQLAMRRVTPNADIPT